MATKTQPEMPRQESRAHLSWDKDGAPKVAGLEYAIMDKTVTVTLVGKVRGYSMADYGCSLDFKPTSVKIEVGGVGAEDDTPTMAESVKAMQRRSEKKG